MKSEGDSGGNRSLTLLQLSQGELPERRWSCSCAYRLCCFAIVLIVIRYPPAPSCASHTCSPHQLSYLLPHVFPTPHSGTCFPHQLPHLLPHVLPMQALHAHLAKREDAQP